MYNNNNQFVGQMSAGRYDKTMWIVALILIFYQIPAIHAVMKISVSPEEVEVNQEITITADNTDNKNYTIKKILFTAQLKTQEFSFNGGFSVLALNSTILIAREPFKLSCGLNAAGPVTVTALDEHNSTVATTTFKALKTKEAFPSLAMFPTKANAEEYRAGETITFSFQANCHEYSLFKFTNVSLTVSAPGFGKIPLYNMPSFAFDAAMTPIDLKPWTIPNEIAYAGITTATLAYTATWPTGKDTIENQIAFFIKGTLKPSLGASLSSEGNEFFPGDCHTLIKGTIATKDNQYFVYKAKATFEDAPKICACFQMVFVALDSSNKISIHTNVLGTIGEATVWLQGYDNQNVGERLAAFVNQKSMVIERYPAISGAQFHVICKPKT